MDRLLPLAIGVIFIIAGRYLPRARPKGWLGIRTPWTLADEGVWRDTHRLAGRTFVAGGVVTIAGAFVPVEYAPYAAMVGIGVAGCIPVLYSFLALHARAGRREP
ncbi:MAG TPA: SdpI family protein [Longimicrobiales bacterium]